MVRVIQLISFVAIASAQQPCSWCQAGKLWVNNQCLDCNAIQNYDACEAAGCSGPPQPHEQCTYCSPGKIWVNSQCTDCNAQHNYAACSAAGCGSEAAAQASPRASALPGVLQGWNTSIGSAEERAAAAQHFGVEVVDNEALWSQNTLTPFVGRTLHMTGIDVIERNPFNTIIEAAVKTGTVLWTVNPGFSGVVGPLTEHINGKYTGEARTAGYVSRDVWLENDNKHFLGFDVADDWGKIEVTSASDSTIVMNYWSYKKAKFIMTWTLTDDAVAV